MKGYRRVAALSMMMSVVGLSLVGATDHITAQEQLLMQRQAQEERDLRLARPNIHIDSNIIKEDDSKSDHTSLESSSFYITKIDMPVGEEELQWLTAIASQHTHRVMDLTAIQAVVRELNQALLDRGYATTQVYIPSQSIASGTLRLEVLVGRLHRIRYAKDSAHIPWQNAFPIREGALLSIRALEQGLEQMKALASQDVTMRLMPASEAGGTDVELSITRKKPVRGSITLDNSGLSATGRWQLATQLQLDHVARANDQLRLSLSGDTSRQGSFQDTRARRIHYTIPNGKDRYHIEAGWSKYHQTVAAQPHAFMYGGTSQDLKTRWEHVLSRTQRDKRTLDIQLQLKDTKRSINGVNIPVQSLPTSQLEIGVSNRKFLKGGTLHSRLAHRIGTHWHHATPSNTASNLPSAQYHMWLLDVDYVNRFTMAHRPATWKSSFHGQWTMAGRRLYGQDMVNIGNRYTIYGFDGEYTLLGEHGWHWRNELSSTIPVISSEAYFAFDIGAVYGPSTNVLVGHSLAGMALGLRGAAKGCTYDVFISTPVYKPRGYRTRPWYTGISVGYSF